MRLDQLSLLELEPDFFGDSWLEKLSLEFEEVRSGLRDQICDLFIKYCLVSDSEIGGDILIELKQLNESANLLFLRMTFVSKGPRKGYRLTTGIRNNCPNDLPVNMGRKLYLHMVSRLIPELVVLLGESIEHVVEYESLLPYEKWLEVFRDSLRGYESFMLHHDAVVEGGVVFEEAKTTQAFRKTYVYNPALK